MPTIIIKVKDPIKGNDVVVGNVRGVAFRKNCSSKQYTRKYKGYGIQESSFQELVLMGVKYIEIAIGKRIFQSDIKDWIEYGVVKTEEKVLQRFLSVDPYMKELR